jgi:hypothetical protein
MTPRLQNTAKRGGRIALVGPDRLLGEGETRSSIASCATRRVSAAPARPSATASRARGQPGSASARLDAVDPSSTTAATSDAGRRVMRVEVATSGHGRLAPEYGCPRARRRICCGAARRAARPSRSRDRGAATAALGSHADRRGRYPGPLLAAPGRITRAAPGDTDSSLGGAKRSRGRSDVAPTCTDAIHRGRFVHGFPNVFKSRRESHGTAVAYT